MSERFPGGIISKTAPVPTGPYENGTAPGVWTLEQQAEFVKQGIWPIAGNVPNYIEDVFQTWLYTGNGSSQTITNGVNLSGRGGMTWIKQRSATRDNLLFDTNRGATQRLFSNLTLAQSQDTQSLTAFNADGFSIGSDSGCNINGGTYASWTFREQPKFFDVVTYTGNGVNGRTVAHNLGSTPGCIIVKPTSQAGDWIVWHRSLAATNQNLYLNTTDGAGTFAGWSSTAPTDTVFTLGSNADINGSGRTYVAYLFAHNAGGFGLTGTDNVISCGSFTTDGSGNATVSLGYEPQWVMYKKTNAAGNWTMLDSMRDMSYSTSSLLYANSSGAELSNLNPSWVNPSATGFSLVNGREASSSTYIYIAIRRGPMRTPTTGTEVYNTSAFSDYSTTVDTNILTDFVINKEWFFPEGGTFRQGSNWLTPRLVGRRWMATNSTNNEFESRVTGFDRQNGYRWEGGVGSGYDFLSWAFRRAPSFADVVCYTGNDVARTINHNLGAVPEMIITKIRDTALEWAVYHVGIGNTRYLWLNSTAAQATASTYWNDTTPTSSVFTVGTSNKVNSAPSPYVAYLFASCPGVSKVGSYTGTGSTQTINCGFTGSARFILIKRTDAVGDWFVYDSYRGIQAGNDPYLLLNNSNAQVSNTNFVDAAAGGFQLISGGTLNTNGGTYIFLAIA